MTKEAKVLPGHGEAADSLNGRPRKTLGWNTPAENLAELIASTG